MRIMLVCGASVPGSNGETQAKNWSINDPKFGA